MLRHYYVSNDLDELEQVEHELESNGFSEPQIHVLSEKDSDVNCRQLNQVESLLKKDVVRSTEIGAVIGIISALGFLTLVYLLNWHQSAAGWVPFIFLAIVILGFCTWEGGFIGIQQPNSNFTQFNDALKKGQHIFFVDVRPEQEMALANVMKAHPNLMSYGFGDSSPEWLVNFRENYQSFMKKMP